MAENYSDAYREAVTEQEQLAILKQAGRCLDQALEKELPSAQSTVQSLKNNAPKPTKIEYGGKAYYDIPGNLLHNEAARTILLKWCDAESFLITQWGDAKDFAADD